MSDNPFRDRINERMWSPAAGEIIVVIEHRPDGEMRILGDDINAVGPRGFTVTDTTDDDGETFIPFSRILRIEEG